MAKPKSSPLLHSNSTWLPVLKPDAWVRLQVYPEAVKHPKAGQDYEHKTKALLIQTGVGNLRFLCTAAGISFRPDHDSVEQLANRLLSSDFKRELIYLTIFHRPRKATVVELFDSATTDSDKKSLQAEVESYCSRRPETVKPFTKLIYLYRANPALLESIHYRHAWRRLPTIFKYTASARIASQSTSKLANSIGPLVSALNKLKPDESYEYFGHSRLADSVTVFVIHRRYPPSVRADYKNKYRLQHDFSTVAFAVNESTNTVSVKIANRALAETVRNWVSDTLKLDLVDSGLSLFSNYQPESVEQAFLGGYDESFGIDLIHLSFRQSFGPNHSPLSLTTSEFSRSIREDLSWLKESKVIRLRSLSDIDGFRLRYEDREVDVEALREKGGSVRFRINDSGLTEELAESLRHAFSEAFLVPLDQSIDPTLLAMGPADIYHFLMGGIAEDQVQPYQRKALKKLIELGLLQTVDGKAGRCTDLQCLCHSQLVIDPALSECSSCQGKLKWENFRRYEEDRKAQFRVIREVLQKASGWKMAPSHLSFESHKFYRLSCPKYPGKTVCVFKNDRLNPGKVETFQRAMFPLIIVHPHGQQGMPVIDASGIAHIGLPYMLAASEVQEDWRKFRDSCKDMISRLLWMEKERVLKTSRLSHGHIFSMPSSYDDRSYEGDVFNLLRSLFPFTVKWGGGNKPDGFSSLVYFPDNNLAKPSNYNWSYDAKYSESTYSFGIGEFRQMFDYVRRIHAPKRLMSLGNRYDAHIIITNSMDEQAMRNAAEFMATQHRLGEEYPDFQLVFLRDSFLTKLWEIVRNSEVEFEKRGTYLSEFFVRYIRDGMREGYCLFDGHDAHALAEDVLNQPPLQQPVDADKLKKDLSNQMKPAGKRPTSRKRKVPE